MMQKKTQINACTQRYSNASTPGFILEDRHPKAEARKNPKSEARTRRRPVCADSHDFTKI